MTSRVEMKSRVEQGEVQEVPQHLAVPVLLHLQAENGKSNRFIIVNVYKNETKVRVYSK